VLPCIAVNQPVGTFYVTSGAARDVLKYLTVSRRGLSPEDRTKVQRALDPIRRKDIAEYVKRDDATFPTSITINADSQRVYVLATQSGLQLVFGREVEPPAKDDPDPPFLQVQTKAGPRWFERLDTGETPAEIIDGQHRFEGLSQAIRESSDDAKLSDRLQSFELTLAVMFDLLPEQCAKVFVTINATQRKVDSSLIADLFALHSTRSPQRVSHLIAVTANEHKDSPFKDGLKMLGQACRRRPIFVPRQLHQVLDDATPPRPLTPAR
jgi:DGQHR domain-containing protein